MASDTTNQINGYSSSYSANSAGSSGSSGSAVDMDTFLQLLSTEMSHQDVMNPMDNTEFISQLAQFTSLQEMQSLTSTASSQYGASLAQYGASLVGKTVTVAAYDDKGNYVEDSGVVTNCDFSTGTPTIVVNGYAYTLPSVMNVVTDNTSSAFQYGASLVGKTVTVSTRDDDGKTVTDTGTVTGCNLKSGTVSVVVNGKSYALSSVTNVNVGDVVADDPTGGSDDGDGDDTPTDPDAPADPDAAP